MLESAAMSKPDSLCRLTAALAIVAAAAAAACRAERPVVPATGETRRIFQTPQAASGPAAPPDIAAPYVYYPNISVDRNVAVAMRDGVTLRADVYRPEAPGRLPVLVYRTPYGKDEILESGSEPTIGRAARAGYAVVVQDVRGRYRSDGEFRPYQQEGKDGYDTIEWAAAQPWSNGRVGTFGLSYPGAVQWLAAMETPPHLVAMFPAMTFATGRHFFYYGGAFNHDWMRWIELDIAPDVRHRKGLSGPKTEKEAQAEWDRQKWSWENYLPLRDLPILKEVAPWYYEWLEHPDDGPYWSFADVTAAHAKIAVPALNFSAWYDSDYGPLGATANFNGVREKGATELARRGQRLILGPWEHGDPSESRTRVGDLEFGANMTLLRSDHPMERPLAEGDSQRRRRRCAGAPLRDGRKYLAGRERVAAQPRAAHSLLPAQRRPRQHRGRKRAAVDRPARGRPVRDRRAAAVRRGSGRAARPVPLRPPPARRDRELREDGPV